MICCLSIKKIHIDYREGYIDISWHHIFGDFSRCISKYTGWAIMQELSVQPVRIFRISWWRKARVKHCFVDVSSWYEFRFARICIDMNVSWFISNFSTTIQLAETASVAGKWVNTVKGKECFFFHIIPHVGLKFPWFHNHFIESSSTIKIHLRFDALIKSSSIIWCYM